MTCRFEEVIQELEVFLEDTISTKTGKVKSNYKRKLQLLKKAELARKKLVSSVVLQEAPSVESTTSSKSKSSSGEGSNMNSPRGIVAGEAYSKYASEMRKLVEGKLGTVVKEDAELALEGIMRGLGGIVAGKYDAKKNEVRISTMPELDKMIAAADEAFMGSYYALEDVNKVSDAELGRFMAEDPRLKVKNDTVKTIAEELRRDIKDAIDGRGLHAVTHEMIHAASSVYMKNNPNADSTKRVQRMYKKAMEPRYAMMIRKKMAFTEGNDVDYWKTSVDEFVAEALSNPGLMAALNEIVVEDEGGTLSKLLGELVSTLVGMLGFDRKDTVYGYVMDGVVAMIEEQSRIDKVEVNDPKYLKVSVGSNQKPATISAIINNAIGCK